MTKTYIQELNDHSENGSGLKILYEEKSECSTVSCKKVGLVFSFSNDMGKRMIRRGKLEGRTSK